MSSLLLYGVFVFVQTVRHRDYFLPIEIEDAAAHPARPSLSVALASLPLLVLALVAVVGLAKKLAPSQAVLLALTLLLSTITMASGSFTVLHGAVRLVAFGAFLVLALVP